MLTQPALLQFRVIVIQNTNQAGWILNHPAAVRGTQLHAKGEQEEDG